MFKKYHLCVINLYKKYHCQKFINTKNIYIQTVMGNINICLELRLIDESKL